ncbi:MAG: M17 family peptidase N-terminal domain-containing protein [Myxococcota bacterium]
MPSLADTAASTSSAPRVRPCDLAVFDAVPTPAIGLFCFADVRPLGGVAGYVDWRALGALSRCIIGGLFSGRRDETLLVPLFGRGGVRRVFLFGLGPLGACDEAVLGQACTQALAVMRRAGVQDVVLAAPSAPLKLQLETQFVGVVHARPHRDVVEVWVEKT